MVRSIFLVAVLVSFAGNALGGSPEISTDTPSDIAAQAGESVKDVTASALKTASDRLYYYGARYYDPQTSVWQSTDPLLLQQGPRGLAAYTYVANNPLRLVDPDGRRFADVVHPTATQNDIDFGNSATDAERRAQLEAGVAVTPVLSDAADAGHLIHDLGTGNYWDAFQSAVGAMLPFVGAAAVKTGVKYGGKALVNAVGESGEAAARALKKGPDGGGDGTLPDDALVCRGGSCTAERFEAGSGVSLESAGKMDGVSVNSAPGASLEELSQSIPHKKVGVTTVGDVRKAGGDVIPSPTPKNPAHCTMCGVTPKQAEGLMTPTVPNPNRVKPPQ